ncbi:uncharacterized protein [Macrobrachium rosenbergii]|uniref:uncharacterized protein n=1 Tax=Macrobrachium rosenbergii TaxID=79674 RepID=UPI0034D754AC
MQMAFLRADFLTTHNLLVNVAAKQLIPRTTQKSCPQKPSRHTTTKASMSQREKKICPIVPKVPLKEMREKIQEYEDVFKDDLKHNLTKPAKHHSAPHRDQRTLDPLAIQMTGPREAHLHEEGIQSPQPMGVTPTYGTKVKQNMAPLQRLPTAEYENKTGQLPSTKYSRLNKSMYGARIFTKIYLLKGYFPVLVANEDIEKTAIITPFGITHSTTAVLASIIQGQHSKD